MFWTYILTNKRNGALYVGHTDDLPRRMSEHKAKVVPGFTKTYGLDRLVWAEGFETREEAFRKERMIKNWKRAWKIELIEKANPNWSDLSDQHHW